MVTPLVSVICLCYNQARFVEEAILSVLAQTYENIELIVVDDASTDASVSTIDKLIENHPEMKFIKLEQNVGNCAAFNRGFEQSTGEFIIDLAADDVLLPRRITKQVQAFGQLDESFGVVFTDAQYIDENGRVLRTHYPYLKSKNLVTDVPSGDVYREVLSRYFIASPSMMIRRVVLEELGGYDESLAYEDFDFWVRSARIYKYHFLNECLTKIRRTDFSMSSGWYKKGDPQLHSTYLICRKALQLNRDEKDVEALVIRIRYEIRQSIFSGNNKEGYLFYLLLQEMKKVSSLDRFLQTVNSLKLPLGWIRRLYYSIRYSN